MELLHRRGVAPGGGGLRRALPLPDPAVFRAADVAARTAILVDETGNAGTLIGEAEARLARISAPDYVDSLVGGVGADWLHRPAVQSDQANDSPSQQRPSRTSHADTVGVVA